MPKEKHNQENPAKLFIVAKPFSGYLNEYFLTTDDGIVLDHVIKPSLEDAEIILLSEAGHAHLCKTIGKFYVVNHTPDDKTKAELLQLMKKNGTETEAAARPLPPQDGHADGSGEGENPEDTAIEE